jgi:hypothetical protein
MRTWSAGSVVPGEVTLGRLLPGGQVAFGVIAALVAG